MAYIALSLYTMCCYRIFQWGKCKCNVVKRELWGGGGNGQLGYMNTTRIKSKASIQQKGVG